MKPTKSGADEQIATNKQEERHTPQPSPAAIEASTDSSEAQPQNTAEASSLEVSVLTGNSEDVAPKTGSFRVRAFIHTKLTSQPGGKRRRDEGEMISGEIVGTNKSIVASYPDGTFGGYADATIFGDDILQYTETKPKTKGKGR